MTYVEANGTEYSLRDSVVHGKPVQICSGGTQNYGRIFESTAGDFVTYVNDTNIYASCYGVPGCTNNVDGYLYFPNGTKSRVLGGQIRWMQDRNGNKIDYTYETTGLKRLTAITDSIGRVVQIQYNVNEVAPYGRCTKLIFKGFDNQDRVIRYSHDSNLANVLRTTQPGDQTAPVNIFYDDPNDNVIPELSGSTPDYVKAVWLPDGRSYQFRYNVLSQLARVVLPTGGAIEYDFYDVSQVPYESPPNTGGNGVTNQIKEKRVYDINNVLLSKAKFSTPTTYTGGVIPPNRGGTVRDMEVFDPAGNRIARSRHYFYGFPVGDYGLLVPGEQRSRQQWQHHSVPALDPRE